MAREIREILAVVARQMTKAGALYRETGERLRRQNIRLAMAIWADNCRPLHLGGEPRRVCWRPFGLIHATIRKQG